MIDIPNHEDSLRELSKTSLVNNVTIVACWSAAEAARYLELYKSYENANFDAIKGKQSSNYAEKLVDFVTVPRSLNKSDAVAMVANFGSLKNAINADTEQLGMISGWGGIKVKRWTAAVEEPFRAKKAAKRGAQASASTSQQNIRLNEAVPLSRVPARDMPASGSQTPASPGLGTSIKPKGPAKPSAQFQFNGDTDDEEEDEDALLEAAIAESLKESQPTQATARSTDNNEDLAGGVASALAKYREQ